MPASPPPPPALSGDLALVGAPLLLRDLGSAARDARLELECGRESVTLELIRGVVHCLPPSSGERRSGSVSGRTLTQLLERGAALREGEAPQRFPLREALAARGASAEQRRAGAREVLLRAAGWHEGRFRLELGPPAERLRQGEAAGKTWAFQPGELLREVPRHQPAVKLLAPDRERRVEGAGAGLELFLEVARLRRLNGTLALRGGELQRGALLVDGVLHGAHAASLGAGDAGALTTWGGLSFEFVPRRPRETPPPLPAELVAELAAQAASWASVLALLGGPQAVFRFQDPAAADEAAQVFGLDALAGRLDGATPLGELLPGGANPPLELLRTLADLVTLGSLLRVR